MPDLYGYLHMADRDLDELLSALRRHDRADADRLLERWANSERDPAEYFGDEADDEDWCLALHLDDGLTAWVHREACLHVAGGRFEHALCQVETYRRPFDAADMAARLTLFTGADR
jgi:hypothetical protein